MEAKASKAERLRVTYQGVARLGDDVTVNCAVLEDGRRGYVMQSLQRAIGFRGRHRMIGLRSFLAEIAPNSLKYFGNSEYGIPVVMPHGGRDGLWVEAGVMTEIASGVIDAALGSRLRKNRAHLVDPCMKIMRALAKTGEVALIDEATGYQYNRAPDALQDLIARVLREDAADWERMFTPDYYLATCKLFGFSYGNRHRALPAVIGKITREWIYDVVFPPEIMVALKDKRKHEKMHQWLTGEGRTITKRQIDNVTAVARTSVDYRDFEARCSQAFPKAGKQTSIVFPAEETA